MTHTMSLPGKLCDSLLTGVAGLINGLVHLMNIICKIDSMTSINFIMLCFDMKYIGADMGRPGATLTNSAQGYDVWLCAPLTSRCLGS